MNRIEELLQRKRADVESSKSRRSPLLPNDDRLLNWDRSAFRILAEIKRASLSAGSIRKIPDLLSLAKAYERAGAHAISVLTEEHYFHGSMEDLRSVRKAVHVPILQKDFVIDEYQILEAKEAGADFVLLIARFLSETQIVDFLKTAEEIRINAIVEITDETDLAKVNAPVRFLGVNSRDLETLEVKTERFEQLRSKLPDAFLIAESGINSLEILQRVMDLGYNGALIGEHFLRADDPEKEISKFISLSNRATPKIKFCGITNERDARMALDAGASALGFVFAESPRRLKPETLRKFRDRIQIPCVGVFRGNSNSEIAAIVKDCALDIAQLYDEDTQAEIPMWRACTITSLNQLNRSPDCELLDLKLSDAEMEQGWKSLFNQNLFALAGGLHPDNVARAISLCHPQWVDVARGVEREPGIKDPEKIIQFAKAVNGK